MKIINLGILAHVDAGKTTLTESLLYTSGAIAELGSVDEGTTRTDTMNLERQRGITIQTAVTSFQWEDVKVNIIDTPGHMDFLAEVYRSLSVLDGAVLLVSAKDGIQAQTRILFHALQIMKIPTIFFINKIDQEGIDLPMVYREMKAKLSSEIIVKQKVGQHPHINVTDNDDMEQWDAVIMGNDELLEKYMSGKPFKMSELEQEENRRFQNGTLFPVYHGSAKNNLGIRQLIEVIASKFYSSTPEGQSELCGQVFKIEYSEKRRRFVYVRIYSGTLHLRDVIRISEKEKIKITEMCVPTNGELYSSDTACSGDIVILPNDVLQLNSILGNEILLPQRKFIENPLPMLQTTIAVKKSEQREILLGALTEISDGDPLLKYYVDTTTHEIILSFLGNVQMEAAGINALQTKNPLDEVLEETISDMNGVKNIEFIQGCVSNMEFPTPFKDGNSHFFTQIGIPENQYEAFSQGLIEGTADRQKLINGKGVIVDNSAKLLSDYYNYTPQIGDIVKVETADGQWEEFTVMGIGKAPNLGGDSASFYFPQELLPMMKENVSNFNITCIVDVERDQLTEVENKIFQLAENRGGIEVFSISDIITYLQEEMNNIKMPLYGLVFFIAVFGLISLINTLMTNIISRQQEFGILQSVGLSSKQFSKMLQTECFYYVSGTAILTLTIGTLTGFVLCKVFNQVGTFGTLTYHFPVLEISIYFVALFFILAAYSVFSVRYSKRHPVIERIKTME